MEMIEDTKDKGQLHYLNALSLRRH